MKRPNFIQLRTHSNYGTGCTSEEPWFDVQFENVPVLKTGV